MNIETSSSMHSGQQPSEYSIDCFENYTASEVFIQGLGNIVNQGDVVTMIRAQKHMLQRFEKTNEMLLNCNALSSSRLKIANEDVKKHVKLLNDMRKDLEYVFKKIRNIKTKLNLQHTTIEVSNSSDSEEQNITTPVNTEATVQSNTTEQQLPIKKPNKKLNTGSSSIYNYIKMEHSPENDKHLKHNPPEECAEASSTTDNSSSSECTSDAG